MQPHNLDIYIRIQILVHEDLQSSAGLNYPDG